MGLYSRDISVSYNGHEIALSASLGVTLTTATYKLYIDGALVDEDSVSVWGMVVGTVVTLRGQIPTPTPEVRPARIKLVANIRVLRANDYLLFVNDEQIHQEWATPGGL